jgi:hypothetical protein
MIAPTGLDDLAVDEAADLHAADHDRSPGRLVWAPLYSWMGLTDPGKAADAQFKAMRAAEKASELVPRAYVQP